MLAQDSPEARANLAAIGSKLAELDDIFLQFCSRHDFRFSGNCQIWPSRRVWCRDRIDKCVDLVISAGFFQAALDRGFHPEFPWSLYAQGTLSRRIDPDIHLLIRPIFERVPYHRLAAMLGDGLERGRRIVKAMNKKEILTQGKTVEQMRLEGQVEFESYMLGQLSAMREKPDAAPDQEV